jgi:hypothetical protein
MRKQIVRVRNKNSRSASARTCACKNYLRFVQALRAAVARSSSRQVVWYAKDIPEAIILTDLFEPSVVSIAAIEYTTEVDRPLAVTAKKDTI